MSGTHEVGERALATVRKLVGTLVILFVFGSVFFFLFLHLVRFWQVTLDYSVPVRVAVIGYVYVLLEVIETIRRLLV